MNVLILEDEQLGSDQLIKMLAEIDPSLKVVTVLQSVSSAIDWLTSNPHPDLILSDIRLLDGVCFEIFQQVKIDKPIIFTTAYDQYAIKAFDVNSIDYLLKPIQKEKLQAALEKFRNRAPATAPPGFDIQKMLNLLKGSTVEYKSRFMVKLGQKIIALPAEKIAYFFSENKLTFIVTKEAKKYPTDQTLEELADLLDPKTFFRINRQYIVTFESIAEMHPYFKGRIKLVLQPKSDDEVVISSERTPAFKKWIDQ
jgi:two-component system, LytTR family, response regulator LytT